jgi:predicted nucleic acid-binding protein
MAHWLIDSNVLLRVLHRAAPEHHVAREAAAILWARGDTPCVTLQSLAEFWNVSTRPATARGGLGLSVGETQRRLRFLKRHLTFQADTDDVRLQWRQLVIAYQVQGVKVHDTKLVASMLTHQIPAILTFNVGDFQRYSGIAVAHPQDLLDGKA